MKKACQVIFLLLFFYPFFSTTTSNAAMSFEEALVYQSNHPKEILLSTQKIKDIYGNKNIHNRFKLLGRWGVVHDRSPFVTDDRTSLDFLIDYGVSGLNSKPFAYLAWDNYLKGAPDKGYEPKNMYISFDDGFILKRSLTGWEYIREFNGVYYSHNYYGKLILTDFDLYEMSKHGKISAISTDDGSGGIEHFFYAGKKDLKNKEKFTNSIIHALKILQIDETYILEKKAQAESERKIKLKLEIEKEIKEENERNALKEEVLQEIKNK